MMVMGGKYKQRIFLNEESMWSGSPFENKEPDLYKHLGEIRMLLPEGKNAEAQECHI
jgi:alpha-L-fucosidase 2